jgi:hypothetical protein
MYPQKSAIVTRLEISLTLEIRSGVDAPPTTMHGFTLRLVDDRHLVAHDGGRMEIATGKLALRSFHFDLSISSLEDAAKLQKTSEWEMTFKDTDDNPYETPVYKHSI